uniref:Putative secreted protein n=1 Tax=Ixodes ricinus TaxID=34613 RepID=A0A6B0U5Z8_IXORI
MGLWMCHLYTSCLWLWSRAPGVALWMLCLGVWPEIWCHRMTGSKSSACGVWPDVLMEVGRVATSCSRAQSLIHRPV